jgi:hypothetical protein
VRSETPAAAAASITRQPAFPPPEQKQSTVDRHARMGMDLHPRLLGKLFRSSNHGFNPSPRVNNLIEGATEAVGFAGLLPGNLGAGSSNGCLGVALAS